MKILVTGACGFLGRSLLQLRGSTEWIGCGREIRSAVDVPYYQVDLEERAAVCELVSSIRPDWIINTAALTNVDQCEVNRELARRSNLELVEHLVQACAQSGAGLLQLSTDYVFDGEDGPYVEQDEPNPLSYYGSLKLASERLVLEGIDRSLVVRTLWLYGYVPDVRPNFITRALDALSRDENLQVFDDQWGNPTYVHDLAQTLVDLCQNDLRGLFHMGGSTFSTRYELALELARYFDLDTGKIEPISTRSAGLQARRPLRSGLRTDTLEAELQRRPMTFAQGLEHMSRQEAFRRSFAHLL